MHLESKWLLIKTWIRGKVTSIRLSKSQIMALGGIDVHYSNHRLQLLKDLKGKHGLGCISKKKNQLANQFSIRNLQPTCPIIQYSVFSHTFVVLKAKKNIAKYRLATFHRNSNSWHIIFHSESAACPQLLRIRFSVITFFLLAPGFSAKKYFSPRISLGYHLISVIKSSNIIQTQIHTHTYKSAGV